MSQAAFLAVFLAVACGGPPRPPDPIGNTGDPEPVPEGPPGVHGVISDGLGQPAIGATVVIIDPGGTLLVGEQVAITNENGEFAFDLPAGAYELTLYYNDLAFRRRFSVNGPTTLNQGIPIDHPYPSGETMVCTNDSADSCR